MFFLFQVQLLVIAILQCSFSSSLSSLDKVYSLDGESIITSEMSTLLQSMKYPHYSTTPSISAVKSGTLNGDRNISLQMEYSYYNGDIGSDIMHLLMVNRNKNVLKGEEAYINVTIPYGIIQSSTRSTNSFPNILSDKNKVKCYYNIPMILYNTSQLINDKIVSAKKNLKYNQITFFLIGEKVYYSIIINSTIELNNIQLIEKESNYISTLSISNIFLINQIYLSDKFIVLEDSLGSLYLYRIIYEKEDNNYYLKFFKLVTLDVAYRNPLMIGMKGNNLYLAITNIGLVECSFINGSNSVSYNILSTTEAEKNIFDFVINEYSIYAISKGIGLYIYDLSFSVIKTVLYKHQFISQIDFMVNPYYGTKYIGIIFKGKEPCSEVFMELLLIDELTPIPNKVFTSCSNSFLHYTLDKYNTFLYDSINRSLYIIRRALLGEVNFVTYKINLDSDIEPISMFSLYEQTSKEHYLMLNDDKGNIVTYSNFTNPKQSFNCSFKEEGTYIIRFTQKSDACGSSLNDTVKKQYPFCQKIVDFNYFIYGDLKHDSIKHILTGVIVIIILLTLILFCIVLNSTKCFKKNSMRVVKIDKENKDDLYTETSDDLFSKEYENVCKRTLDLEKPRLSNLPPSNRKLIRVMEPGLDRKSSNDVLFQLSKRSTNELADLSHQNYNGIPDAPMNGGEINSQIIEVKKWNQ